MNDKFSMFANRLAKVYKHKSKIAKRLDVGCWRIYDHDLPEFPLIIELYEDRLCISEYRRRHGMDEEEHINWLDEAVKTTADVLEIDEENIFLRERKKMSHRSDSQYQKQQTTDNFFTVKENGLKFLINLEDYLDTGLFLDHRITRKMVMDISDEKRVLNLFCYTGSFSVYAAAGGASAVTSVDMSKTYLSWAEDNFVINKLKDKNRYHFIHADVMQYINELKPGSFDIIIVDPPTFSNSKRMKDYFDVQQHHALLLNKLIKAAAPGGIIFFSTNYSKFILDKENIKASSIKDITKLTTPFDFENKLKRWCYKIDV